jgi:hypothetical protein
MVFVDPKAYGPPDPTVEPAALVKLHETISSQPLALIVTTIAPPLPPVEPVPAVTVPVSWPLAPAQIMTSLPALTTGFVQGGVGQLTE